MVIAMCLLQRWRLGAIRVREVRVLKHEGDLIWDTTGVIAEPSLKFPYLCQQRAPRLSQTASKSER